MRIFFFLKLCMYLIRKVAYPREESAVTVACKICINVKDRFSHPTMYKENGGNLPFSTMLADFFGRNRNQKDSKCRPLPRLYFSAGYTIHSPFGLMRIPIRKWQERTRFLAFVTVNFTSGIRDLLVVLAKLRTELRSFINFCTIETAQSKNSRDICKCIPGSGIPSFRSQALPTSTRKLAAWA